MTKLEQEFYMTLIREIKSISASLKELKILLTQKTNNNE